MDGTLLIVIAIGLLHRRFAYKPEDRKRSDYIGTVIMGIVIYALILGFTAILSA